MKRTTGWFFSALFLLAFEACSRRDRERPLIQLLNFPEDTIWLRTGDTLHLTLRFSDNEALAQYKIDIHDNLDGHDHPKMYRARPWSRLIIGSLVGRDQVITEIIPVYDSAAAGPYHLMVRAVDKAGNEANFILKNLVIKNTYDTLPPHLNIIQFPSDGATLTGPFPIELQLSDDNSGLFMIKTRFTQPHNQAFHATIDTLHVQPLTYTYQKNFSIPSWFTSGEVILQIDVFDGAYNRKSIKRNFYLNM
ncbi:MAG: DUF4625 domain-containing protein [Flavobacteriales bacterium]|nr:DUF4625 domain-containing protein [Flavobacteriales bacterium]MDW8409868.1 DUF4625 domain-containing protein [Flavobacteriales bacterium]